MSRGKLMWRTPTSETTIHVDAHNPDRAVIRSREYDKHFLERNKRIRLEGLMKKGQRLPFDGSEVRYAFSIPPVQHARLRRTDPDIIAMLDSKDIEENLKGAQRLAMLHPEWLITEANR
jgi:hypothetical protein